MSRSLALFAVVCLALISSIARAGTVGVVVTGEPAMQPQLASQLETWLTRHGHPLVAAPLAPDAINLLIDCFVIEDEGCARAVIDKRSRSEAIVYARVEIQPGGDVEKTVTMLAYWFEQGKPAVAERRSCQRCTEQTLRSTADELMDALAKAGQKEPMGKLVVTSAPTGATVAIDGTPVGLTPLEHHTSLGPHEITISYLNHEPQTRRVEIAMGETAPIDVALAREAGRRRLLPVLVIAGGAALAVTGAILIAIDQDPARDLPPRITNTAPLGVGLAIAGVAAAAGGYAWLRITSKRESAPVAAVTPRGAYVGWAARF